MFGWIRSKVAYVFAAAGCLYLNATTAFAQTEGTITVDPQGAVSDVIDDVNSAMTLIVPAVFVLIAIGLVIRKSKMLGRG